MFLLENDGGEYSSFGMMCLNEGIKEILKIKNESSSSLFGKIG